MKGGRPPAITALLRRANVTTLEACWPWIGYKNHAGYGMVWADGKSWRAHRLSYAQTLEEAT